MDAPPPSLPSQPNAKPALVARAPWWRGYSQLTLAADCLAGLTLAAYLIPAAIGDASLARLAPEAGLYACLFAGLVFWIFCSSRRTAVTVTSAISLLVGTSLADLADGDTAKFAAFAAATAILVSMLAFIAWLVRAGALVSFVSETVLIGFKAGVALTLASTQLPKLLGISSGHGSFLECGHHFLTHLDEADFPSAAVGLSALALLLIGKAMLKNKPVALVVVIGGIVAAGLLGLGDRGVKLLGELPQGLPPIGLPHLGWSHFNDVLPLAMACFLLGAVETTAIGRMFAAKHGDRLNPNREFLALAGANLAAGLGQGFPVSGGMSQSLVNESAGARTPLSGLFAALLILVVAFFFTDLLRNLPQPVLAAIVLMAVLGLIKVESIAHLWKSDRTEFIVFAAALAGVLASGLLRGVLIGAVISLFLLIRRASRPHIAFLGRIPGSRRYSDLERHTDNQQVPGIVIFRPEGSVVYFNAEHVHDAAVEHIHARSGVHTVICDLSAAPHMDIAGAEMFNALARELHQSSIRLRIVEARSSVRDKLRKEEFDEHDGRIDRFTTVADAVEASERDSPSSSA